MLFPSSWGAYIIIWTPELKGSWTTWLPSTWTFRAKDIYIKLPQSIPGLVELDIERTLYLSPKECCAMLSQSRLTIFKFSPRWKRPPAWREFLQSFTTIKSGQDFESLLKRVIYDFYSVHFIELCQATPTWASHDTSDSDWICNQWWSRQCNVLFLFSVFCFWWKHIIQFLAKFKCLLMKQQKY